MIIKINGSLIDFSEKLSKNNARRAICPSCGMEFETYLETGRLGCSVCYDTFREQIAGQLKEWEN